MTVLSKYQRLECDGVWQASARAQRRDVSVSLGEATLMINDATGSPLAHWSLPAVERINPAATPALYRPGGDAEDVLEIADGTMIDAIRTIQAALNRTKPHPGRLRRAVIALSAAAVLALGLWWLPHALVRHTASVLPETVRTEIGQRLLRALGPYVGQVCTSPKGRAALARLRAKVLREPGWNVAIVTGGPRSAAHLPGHLIVLRRDLLDDARGPEAAAGAMLLEATRVETRDPMLALLETVGPRATFGLLTRGQMGQAALDRHAGQVLVAPRVAVPPAAIEDRLAEASVSLAPYLQLAEPPEDTFSPLSTGPSGADLLDDAAWLRLQSICEE